VTGGATATGAVGGTSNTDCRSGVDCPMVDPSASPQTISSFECVAPGESVHQPPLCGAPGWCGECGCPEQRLSAEGLGRECASNDDCAAPTDLRAARHCGTNQRCEECLTSADCPAALPVCEAGRIGRECFECLLSTDCPTERPHCVLDSEVVKVFDPSLGGACKECLEDADCATGVCIYFECVPLCSTDADCGPFEACESAVCVPVECTVDADCGERGECRSGTCTRKSCVSDTDCDTGDACVNRACYPGAGTCRPIYTGAP